MNHPNSKTITIFRTMGFLQGTQAVEAQDYFDQAKMSVGSYFESATSMVIGSGLNHAEQELLFPSLVDYDPADRDFRKAVRNFLVDIDTPVPPKTGVTLEIGLEKSNDKPVAKDNMPLNLMDYIRYRHALGHPDVAPTKEAAEGNRNIKFYIFDRDLVNKKNKDFEITKDQALEYYLKTKSDPEKLDAMLTAFGKDIREYASGTATVDKAKDLKALSEKEPAKFIEHYNQNDLEVMSWIKNMVNTGIIKQINSRYIDAETNKVIGNNLEETIYFFKDEENVAEVNLLKGLLQEKMIQPVTRTRRTVRKNQPTI